MGTKGLETRRRLLDAMIGLLGQSPLRDLRVKSIASRAGLSPATFYLYFENVRDCLYAAAASISQSSPAMLELLDQDWSGEGSAQNALMLVIDHLEVWEQHRVLLRARNLAAEEGDLRFVRQRRHALSPAVRALASVIASNQERGVLDREVTPLALSSALFAMLDLASSYIDVHERNRAGLERRQIEATSYIVSASLGWGGAAG